MSLRLIVHSEDRRQRIPLVEGPNRLGSSPDCAVRIAHPSVSRRHAVIYVRDGRAEVEDAGSRNGTRIAGRKVEGRRLLAVGERVIFGGVTTELEEVSAKDLEPAVTFSTPPPEPSDGDDALIATAEMGSIRAFAVKKLPDLLARLAGRCGPVSMCQAVGEALFETLPSLSVEVLSAGGRGLLFSARHPKVGVEWRHEARAEAGAYAVRAALVHASHVQSYGPLIETGALLIQLAAADEPQERLRPLEVEPPALPEPPTVVPAVRRIYADAGRVARGDVSVVIRGASGTGKEVLARYLHAASPRAEGAFVALNCAALPRDLLESELFGIESGVATGVESRPGKFEMAAAGTLFLDEIGDMALETQARILRVLQEGEVYRLGGQKPRSADVRVLAASHRDLEAMLADGSFRSDLYHRIADWTVRLPTLAERRADIPNLAAYFLAGAVRRRGLEVAGISRGAMDLLEAYHWPGNIRQLEREMARAALFLESGELLESSHLQQAIRDAEGAGEVSLKDRLERVERQEIRQSLARCEGSVSAAAKELQIGLSTLYRRMRELGVEPEG